MREELRAQRCLALEAGSAREAAEAAAAEAAAAAGRLESERAALAVRLAARDRFAPAMRWSTT